MMLYVKDWQICTVTTNLVAEFGISLASESGKHVPDQGNKAITTVRMFKLASCIAHHRQGPCSDSAAA